VTLKLGFGVTQGHRKRHYSIEYNTPLYASIYYRFRDIATYCSKIDTLIVFGAPVRGKSEIRQIYATTLGDEKLE